jgi:mannose-6-phosphate isomerase-like protein (cupin superfamily)
MSIQSSAPFFSQVDLHLAAGPAPEAASRSVLFESPAVTSFLLHGPAACVGAHLHEEHDELGIMIEGSGTLTIGDEVHEIGPGSTWAIPRQTPHSAEFTATFRILSWFTPWDDPANPDRVDLG